MKCNVLQLHIIPRKKVMSYLLHVIQRAVTSNVITYYIRSLQALS